MTPWIAKPVPFNIGQGAGAAAVVPEETCPVTTTDNNARISNPVPCLGVSVSAGSSMIGKNVTDFSFWLYRTATLSGTLSAFAYEASSDVPDTPIAGVNFGTLVANTIGLNAVSKHTFPINTGSVTVTEDTQFGLDFASAGSHSGDVWFNTLLAGNEYGKMYTADYSAYYETHTQVPKFCYTA